MAVNDHSRIFPSIVRIDRTRFRCAICDSQKGCGFYDRELSPGAFCDECRIHVCRADVFLRMAGLSRPHTNQS